jgi:hypothetical protein
LVGSVAQTVLVCQVVTKSPEWIGSCHPANTKAGINVNSKKKIIKQPFFIIFTKQLKKHLYDKTSSLFY